MIKLLRLLAGFAVLGISLIALLAFLGFAVPEFDLLNHLQVLIFPGTVIALVLAALLFRRGATLVLSGLAVVAFVASAITYLPEAVSGFSPRPASPGEGRPTLRLMTHNLFGLNYDMVRVSQNIFAEDPDVIALQEYFPEQRGPLHPLLQERYPYSAVCTGGKRANIALYSRLPFSAQQDGACSEAATAQQRTSRVVGTFTLANGASFSVMTTHLDWPLPIARQQNEMEDLAVAIEVVQGPLIVVGDLNSTPWSYALRRFVSETGLERQTRNLITWPLLFGGDDSLLATIPFLPLDHVLTRGIEVHEIHTGQADGSDHLPVVFTFSVP